MAHYRSVGEVPPKRHTQHRDPDGHLYREELMGEEGFSSDSSLLYHRGVPSAIVASEVWELPDQTRTPNHPLKPRHLKLHELATGPSSGTDPVTGRRMVLGNNDVRIAYVVTGTEPSQLYRNAIGDECVYVESGTGTVETVFGALAYRAGSTRSRPTATSRPRSATCLATDSCSSTRRTASATCTARPRCSCRRARTSRCSSSTAPAPASWGPG